MVIGWSDRLIPFGGGLFSRTVGVRVRDDESVSLESGLKIVSNSNSNSSK